MLIFLILGVLLFPKINADEIKIVEDGSVQWIRLRKLGPETKQVVVNTEMKYKIESPLHSTIGKLEKETKIEGCQHRGCNIILRFGDGTVFYQERIYKSIDKIVIDLGQSRLNDNYHFEKKGNK